MKPFLIVILLCATAFAGKKWYKHVDIDGSIAVGMETVEKSFGAVDSVIGATSRDPKRILEGELDFTVRFSDYISAEMDIQSDINTKSAKVKKGFITFDFNENSRFRVGSMKKSFGFEEMSGKRDRPLIQRSYLHRYMDSFHGLGYDFQLLYRHSQPLKKDQRIRVWTAAGSDADIRVFGSITGEYKRDKLQFLLSSLFVKHDIKSEQQNFFMTMAGVELNKKNHTTQHEIAFGKDPNATELFKNMNTPKDILYTGMRNLYGYRFEIENRKILHSLEPLLESTLLVPNINSDNCKWQLTPGFTMNFHPKRKIRWMTNVEFLFSFNESEQNASELDQVSIASQIIALW